MLSHRIEFAPERDAEIFPAIPRAAAVFLLRGSDPEAEPYVSKTANLRRRLERLLGAPEERSRKLNLRSRVAAIEYTLTGSDFESSFLLYQLLRTAFPKTYADRLRFRPAPLVKLHLENEYPRASVTTRLGRQGARQGGQPIYYGPFATRVAAEKFLNDALDFFLMRRCPDDLHPDPSFPGCVYSEMKMCMAPCFRGCTDDAYRAEVSRVRAFLDSGGVSLEREFSVEREAAAARLEFEEAAAIHTKMEKLRPVVSQLPELVRPLNRLNGVIVQTSSEANAVTLFQLDGGHVSGPITFLIQPPEHTKSQSMEARLQMALAAAKETPSRANVEIMEHLSFLKRWYYRSTRAGEIFLVDEKEQLPLRRLVRGIGRVFRGEKPETVSGNLVRVQTEVQSEVGTEVREAGHRRKE